MKIDAEKGEGVNLANSYGVSGFPTILFLESNGREVDRIVGYLPLDNFLEESKRIKNRIDTFDSLQEQVKVEPKNIVVLEKLAEKNENRSDLKSAKANWVQVLEADKLHEFANYKFYECEAREKGQPKILQDFITENPNNDNLSAAYQWVLSLIKRSEDTGKEIAWYQKYAKFMKNSEAETAFFLNAYAWRMSELDTNLDDALICASRAVEMETDPQRKAQILDTKAEVLWKLSKTKEAILIIEQAILLQPEDDYYKEQKEKFLE